MIELIAGVIFLLGYIAIAFEHRLFVNKAAAALLLATALWALTSAVLPVEMLNHRVVEAGADLFGLVIFLLASMTLVEILVHYHLFDVVERWLRSKGWHRYQLGWAIAALTFVFSMFVANLTAAIVAIQIARRLFPKQEILYIGALIVVCANAGGAFSPIGDVVTLLLWFADKFTTVELMSQGALPSVVLAGISSWFLLRTIKPAPAVPSENGEVWYTPSRSDWVIITAAMVSFLLPLGAAALGLPAYFGLLAGLGGVWLLVDVAKRARPQDTHLDANISKFLQASDLESIQFFVGVLLAVAALHSLGVLDIVTSWLLGEAPSFARTVASFAGLGVASALLDNVPLTAAAVSAVHNVSSSMWVLLSITVGTGGSLLVIGSAAGVVAMGMLRKLTFGKYLQIATIPSLLGFIGGIAVWVVQYQLFN